MGAWGRLAQVNYIMCVAFLAYNASPDVDRSDIPITNAWTNWTPPPSILPSHVSWQFNRLPKSLNLYAPGDGRK